MKLPLTGGCQCGALRYEVSEAPHDDLYLSLHRLPAHHRQRVLGRDHVPDSAFRLTKGEPRLVQRTADSGRVVTRWLCPECGCWIVGSVVANRRRDRAAIQSGSKTTRRRRSRRSPRRYVAAETNRRSFWTATKQTWVAYRTASVRRRPFDRRSAGKGRNGDGGNSRARLHPLADLVPAERAADRCLQPGARRAECRSRAQGPGELAVRTARRTRQR